MPYHKTNNQSLFYSDTIFCAPEMTLQQDSSDITYLSDVSLTDLETYDRMDFVSVWFNQFSKPESKSLEQYQSQFSLEIMVLFLCGVTIRWFF